MTVNPAVVTPSGLNTSAYQFAVPSSGSFGSGVNMNAIETVARQATNAGAETPLLETRALGAGYGPVSVVRSLDLSVVRGEVLGILGPNGAGKTTLIRSIITG